MTEQAIAAAAAPLEAAALEELHQLASAEIERLETTVPPRLAAAEQGVKNYVEDFRDTLHRFVASIDRHRQGASATPADAVPPTQPAAASTPPPTSTASATQAASSTPGSATAAPTAK